MKIAAIILLFAGAVTALVSAGKNSSNDLANNTEAAGVSVPSVFTLDKVTPAPKGKAHNFTWKDGSKTVSFADYTKGKVVLLNFWGTWCGPCRMEIPDIIGVSKDLKDKDFVVIGIPLENDVNNAVKNVTTMVKTKGISYINIIDLKRDLDKAYGRLPSVPTTFIIDKSGNITESLVGSQQKEVFLKAINRVLK